ncbi:hypothetical protein Back11_14500 [Paenibacillus baekrokdamisoli]|uniref:Uncharacterized protein n=1 Tax=Paenibacillus baekrokdamisoli TaxID=1712516 RepID=A0A3G9IVH3_9BACL|nr:hypothetical protein [Paenibacillus baekrokdamisoli]MBB3070755.1 hypothetical protein [Paenibacillus baekrokdamisoli]BBH20105.1 hypothetical protein Back11_14500 [Paenibacillus baekrokdamisoli]
MSMYTALLLLAGAVCVFSLISSIYYVRKQEGKELDKNISMSTVRHPVKGNPAIVAYWMFPIVVVLGAILLAFFMR